MKKAVMKKTLLLSAALLTLSATTAQAADNDCSLVRMAEPGWTDLAFTSGVATVVLEGLGYEIDSDVLGLPIIYESLSSNDLDVFLGYWDPAMDVYYKPYRENGSVKTIHTNLEGAKFTFAVPKYVFDSGVTDFSDLQANVDRFEQKLYGIEPGSNDIMLDIVSKDAFGLGEWEVVESSEQGMLSQVNRKVRREEWIAFLAWAPHPMNTEFEIEYLTGGDDFYGPNFGGATVHTQVRDGYQAECENVGKLLTQMTFDVPMESKGMGYILNDGDSAEEAARKVLAEQPYFLEQWLAGVTTLDGQNGLDAVRQHLGL